MPHNLKVTGSNSVPATKKHSVIKDFKAERDARLLLVGTSNHPYNAAAAFSGATEAGFAAQAWS
jgi:hypothetical protein